MRCLALARALAAKGHEVRLFASSDETPVTVPALAASGLAVRLLACDPSREPEMIGRMLNGHAVSWLIVDHYHRDAGFEAACRVWAKRILCIDDLCCRAHDCDLLLDPTPGRQTLDYRLFVKPQCRLLLGTDYAMLRPEFLGLRAQSLRRRSGAPRPRKLLLSFGLTDFQGLALTVMKGLDACRFEGEMHVLSGSQSPFLGNMRDICQGRPNWHLHVDTADVAQLMAGADLAVGAVGTTIWEMCCLGLPSVTVETADNQRANATWLTGAGVTRHLGRYPSVPAARIIEAVLELWNDPDLCRGYSAKASEVCDGRGIDRILGALT